MKPRAVVVAALALGLVASTPAQETRASQTDAARIAKLAAGSEKEALGALFYLEDARSTDVAAWKLLLARRDEPRVLARVVRGLGRVGDPTLKPLLVDVVLGWDGPWTSDLQNAAALAVGLFGDPELVPKLAAKATLRDVSLAIGLMKKLPADGGGGLLSSKDGDAAESRPDAGDATFTDPVEAALRWGAVVEATALADLARKTLAAKDTSPLHKHAAVDFFARSKAKAPADLRPAIQALLASANEETAGLAARALAKSEGAGAPEAEAIEAAFLSAPRIAQVDQVRALSALQVPKSFEALSHMLVLSKTDPAVRRTVLESLKVVAAKLPEDTKKIVAATVVGILQPDEKETAAPADVQAAAVTLLAAVDPAQFAARLPVFRLAAAWQVRAAAAASAPESGPRSSWFLDDPDRRVVIAALEARKDAGRPFVPASVSDPVVASCAAATLSGSEAGVDAFLESASRLIPDHEVEVLQSILDLAAKTKRDSGNAILRRYLASPEISLRARAKELLAKNGIEAKEPPVDDATARKLLDASVARAKHLFDNLFASAVIETNRGNITISLFPFDAPATVENFLSLAKQGFYDGILWHRVVPAFVAQAGCPRGDGWGGPGHTIRCEVNDRTYRRGSVGMALAGKDTGGSQFFICHRALPHLDGRYTLFGQVTGGMDVVDKLGQEDYIIRVREL